MMKEILFEFHDMSFLAALEIWTKILKCELV